MKKNVSGRSSDLIKRAAILDAAYSLFCSMGLLVSIEAIAKKANVAKQTIYSAFATKELLFQAAIQHATNKITKTIEQGDLENPKDTLKDIAKVYCLLALDKNSMDMVIHLIKNKPYTKKKYKKQKIYDFDFGPDQLASLLAQYLERVSLTKTLKVRHPFLAADLFIGSLKGLVRDRYWLSHDAPPTPEDISKRIDYAVEMFMKAHCV